MLTEVKYPFHDLTSPVYENGSISIGRKFRIPIGAAFVGQTLGLCEVDEDIWKITFMDLDLGYYDKKEKKFEPLKNPLANKQELNQPIE